MSRFFVDTNVLLDFLGQRDPFTPSAERLFEEVARQKAVLYASGLSFSHIDYALRKVLPASERLDKMTRLAELVEIIPVGRPVLEAALQPGFADFEDGLPYCAARTVPAISAIVTRDAKGFAAGTLPVLSPPEALARLA